MDLGCDGYSTALIIVSPDLKVRQGSHAPTQPASNTAAVLQRQGLHVEHSAYNHLSVVIEATSDRIRRCDEAHD